MNRRTALQIGALAPLAVLNLSQASDAQGWGQAGNALSTEGFGTPTPIAIDNPSIVWREAKCQMCDHCQKSCGVLQSVRGFYDIKITKKPVCIHCGQCTNLCKSGAMTERYVYPSLGRAIKADGVTSAISVAPAVRVSLGELFGYPAGTNVEGKTVAALKELGFDYVFDTTFGADLTVVEEAKEFIKRLESNEKRQFPMFTSCCPGWVSFAEYWFPEFLPYLSTSKSPMLMQGALIKSMFAKEMKLDPSKIVSALVAPCTAKKYEITRPEMNAAGVLAGSDAVRDMDWAITVRELGRWIDESGIDFEDLEPAPFDSVMSHETDAGLIFGATGGVMEATLRTAYWYINDKPAPPQLQEFTAIRGMDGVKEAEVDLGKAGKIKVAAVHGGANARALLNKIRDGEVKYDFVEVMICPGGCIGGGGQPIVKGREAFQAVRQARIKGLYGMIRGDKPRLAHENPDVQRAYSEFLSKDGSDLSSRLLHTNAYVDRSGDLQGKS